MGKFGRQWDFRDLLGISRRQIWASAKHLCKLHHIESGKNESF
jgi:biotin operon repressor